MNTRWLMLRQLNRQLEEWQSLNEKYGKPRLGWVKTIRVALDMTAEQLAHRLGVTRSRITQLEAAEVHGAVTLNTLRNVADTLNCELVYAIVPKGSSALEDIIKTRAQEVASKEIARVAHSMSLEAQSIDDSELKSQQEEFAKSLFEHFSKKLWVNDEPSNTQNEKLKSVKNAKLNRPVKGLNIKKRGKK